MSEALKQHDNYIREITADLTAEAVKDVHDKIYPVFQIALSISPYSQNRYLFGSDIDLLGKAFAEEITFLYYLNLHNNEHFPEEKPLKYYSALISNSSKPDDFRPSLSPIQTLSATLEENKQIKRLFSNWIGDILDYQGEILKTMEGFYNELSKQH